MLRNLALGSLLLFTTGCWVGSLFVKNLDTLISVKVSNTFDLYYKQKQQLDEDIDNFLKRKKPLADIALKKLSEYQKLSSSAKLDQKLIKNELMFWQKFYTEIMLEIVQKHSSYLINLTEKQQKHFFKEYKERTKELKEKLEEDLLEDQIEKYERFFGELNKDMTKELASNEDFFKSRLMAYIERRKEFRIKLEELYKKKAKDKDFKSLFSKYIEDRFSKTVTIHHAKIIHNLLRKMGSDQKIALKENLTKYKTWVEVFKETDY
tara:strand:- start:91125 stop:91916 length:792 start_codon:yes stop_codon:yes gene_type:complete